MFWRSSYLDMHVVIDISLKHVSAYIELTVVTYYYFHKG